MRSRNIVLILSIVAIFSFAFVPVTSTSEGTADTDVSIISDIDSIDVSAGNSNQFSIIVVNNLPYAGDHNLANVRDITISFTVCDDISVSVDSTSYTISGGDWEKPIIKISTDRFMSTGSYQLKIDLDIRSLDSSDTTVSKVSDVFTIVVTSALDNGSAFNKILGTFNNPLPEPFNTPLVTAIISFFLCMLIGLFMLIIITPFLIHLILGNDDVDKKRKYKRGIQKLLFIIIFLYSIGSTLFVYGAPISVLSAFSTWSDIFYIILGSLVIWKVYQIFIGYTLAKIHREISEEGVEEDVDGKSDLEPLFNLIGKVLIFATAAAAIVASFGLDLAAIITSAGLVSLGITYGAQSTLNQFFSGVVILLTRPFKAGDLVQIGNNTKTYRVKKVTVMNTMFENWDNEDMTIMPNNTVSSSPIINLTGRSLTYKIHVYMTIAYGTDLNSAKKIMLDIGMNHPDVIIDGSVDFPYVRTTEFEDSAIQLRLTVFIRDYNDYGKVGGELRESIYKAFNDAGIKIPFPQIDVHIDYIHDRLDD